MTRKQFELLSYILVGIVFILLLFMWLNIVPASEYMTILLVSVTLLGIRVFLRFYFRKKGFKEN
jgi:c-di-AMP phosphodiesterase-like protein